MLNVTTHQTHSHVLPKSERAFHDEWSAEDINELQMGMIKSAIEDLRDGRKSKKMQLEAKEWLLSNDLTSPFSFINCCSALGLDADNLRILVNKMTQGGLNL